MKFDRKRRRVGVAGCRRAGCLESDLSTWSSAARRRGVVLDWVQLENLELVLSRLFVCENSSRDEKLSKRGLRKN